MIILDTANYSEKKFICNISVVLWNGPLKQFDPQRKISEIMAKRQQDKCISDSPDSGKRENEDSVLIFSIGSQIGSAEFPVRECS